LVVLSGPERGEKKMKTWRGFKKERKKVSRRFLRESGGERKRERKATPPHSAVLVIFCLLQKGRGKAAVRGPALLAINPVSSEKRRKKGWSLFPFFGKKREKGRERGEKRETSRRRSTVRFPSSLFKGKKRGRGKKNEKSSAGCRVLLSASSIHSSCEGEKGKEEKGGEKRVAQGEER